MRSVPHPSSAFRSMDGKAATSVVQVSHPFDEKLLHGWGTQLQFSYLLPSTSFAMVASCMFDVPS
jgi:hypothetical protein